MQDKSIWEQEIKFLAEHWQPRFVEEVLAFFRKRLRAMRSPENAFAQTYAKFFMNPSARELQQ